MGLSSETSPYSNCSSGAAGTSVADTLTGPLDPRNMGKKPPADASAADCRKLLRETLERENIRHTASERSKKNLETVYAGAWRAVEAGNSPAKRNAERQAPQLATRNSKLYSYFSP